MEEKLTSAAQREANTRGAPATQAATGRRVDLRAAERAINDFLTALGHPPSSDPQLRETGALVARAFHEELLAGYATDPAAILRDTVAASSGDLVIVRDLAVTCMCPHHLLPASGMLHLGYLPGERIVGFGALERLAQALSRRLILQEALCEQIAQALTRELGARGAGCVAELQPMCLTARGQRPGHSKVVTAATSGVLRDDADLRREFFSLVRSTEGRP